MIDEHGRRFTFPPGYVAELAKVAGIDAATQTVADMEAFPGTLWEFFIERMISSPVIEP